MATKEQVNNFINMIAPIAQEAYKELGKVLPSVAVGMACVECGYGTAGSCKHNSYLGHKVGSGRTATKYWGGKFFTSKTSEEYTIGVHTTINAAFRAYASMNQCVFNFSELLNTNIYKGVEAGADYEKQMKQIKSAGYMTSSTEVNSVISIIERYGLTKYDDVAAGEKPAATKRHTLRRGDRGEDVVHLQTRLAAMGYSVGKIDGIFGVKTLESVKAVQIDNNLSIDGIVGVKTWAVVV